MATPGPAPMDDSKLITINPDGTFDPPGGVTINNSGTVKFTVSSYQPGTNTCNISFGSITFSQDDTDTGGNSVKVG
jgi:hypothetical protein